VLNRPSETPVIDVTAPMGMRWRGDPSAVIWVGGPVSPESGWLLHEPTSSVVGDGTLEITDGVSLSTSPQNFRVLVEHPPRRLRFLAGYAGWGAHQLESELAQGAWLTADATSELVFDTPPERMGRGAALAGDQPSSWCRASGCLGPTPASHWSILASAGSSRIASRSRSARARQPHALTRAHAAAPRRAQRSGAARHAASRPVQHRAAAESRRWARARATPGFTGRPARVTPNVCSAPHVGVRDPRRTACRPTRPPGRPRCSASGGARRRAIEHDPGEDSPRATRPRAPGVTGVAHCTHPGRKPWPAGLVSSTPTPQPA
jgi:putative transcriptional regulator